MKKIAIIADLHSNMFAFNKILEELKNENIDEYIFLGDYVLDGFDFNEVLEKIRDLTDNVVLGNKEELLNFENMELLRKQDRWKNVIYTYDRIKPENFEYIRNLPIYKTLSIENRKICYFHGSPYNTREGILEDSYEMLDKLIKEFDFDIYLMGHTHINFYKEYKGKIFINPGTASFPIEGESKFSYGILYIDGKNVNYKQMGIDYDYEEAKSYLLSQDYHINAKIWAELLLCHLKYCQNYTLNFSEFVSKEANNRKIDISKETPNSLWNEMYKEFKKIHKEIEEI